MRAALKIKPKHNRLERYETRQMLAEKSPGLRAKETWQDKEEGKTGHGQDGNDFPGCIAQHEAEIIQFLARVSLVSRPYPNSRDSEFRFLLNRFKAKQCKRNRSAKM
jgi:hypothetical protein